MEVSVEISSIIFKELNGKYNKLLEQIRQYYVFLFTSFSGTLVSIFSTSTLFSSNIIIPQILIIVTSVFAMLTSIMIILHRVQAKHIGGLIYELLISNLLPNIKRPMSSLKELSDKAANANKMVEIIDYFLLFLSFIGLIIGIFFKCIMTCF
ncbi:MAG TPA: hypothetical protein PKV16_08890 [Caldisericia bacterium]|nr:hypothetical protein [Caldisericia bacterium]HPF49571.1 hypothetical protein [Caldisericia bacterium]HPI84513.1 hypothetical protein [Caldisericia bacterium]HPQ93879.1 hypothetical protein [Caldisericia bacterium]HRV75424.1 hypothetical protein [Caldisericia bacterium]